MTKFNKYQYVELLIQPGNANPGFTPQQFLLNRQIFSAEVFSSDDINGSRSNLPIATPAMIEGMTFNAYCTDVNLPNQAIPNSALMTGQGWGLWLRDVPLTALHRVSSGSDAYVRDLFELYGTYINFEQSYVNISQTVQALITVPTVVIFGFGYK